MANSTKIMHIETYFEAKYYTGFLASSMHFMCTHSGSMFD